MSSNSLLSGKKAKLVLPPGPVFDSFSQPKESLLYKHAPEKVWKKALSEAKRSPMGIYGSGAVLYNKKTGKILSSGCSHPSPDGNMRTTHAERHALKRSSHLDFRNSEIVCLICTLSSRSGGWAWNSSPCLFCAQNLVRRGIKQAVYALRDPKTGIWRVCLDQMKGVLDLSIEETVIENKKKVTYYSRNCEKDRTDSLSALFAKNLARR